jgi:hypothetical protein
MKRFVVGALAVLLLTGVAFAQTAGTNPPSPPPQDQQADGPQNGGPQDDGGGWFGWGRHHGRGGHGKGHGGGYGGMMESMMMGQGGKGFHIMVGPGHGLHINCGEEPMKDCVAAAQPLIDALAKLDFKPPVLPAPAQ